MEAQSLRGDAIRHPTANAHCMQNCGIWRSTRTRDVGMDVANCTAITNTAKDIPFRCVMCMVSPACRGTLPRWHEILSSSGALAAWKRRRGAVGFRRLMFSLLALAPVS
jgi:hypothetical protein